MRILVIGSRGFIGSHCVDFFSKENEVVGCDVFIDYNTPNYLFVESVSSDFQYLFLQQKFDVCINCSGTADVAFSMGSPYRDFQLNTLNTFKILEGISRFNPECKYISLSSASVYGNPNNFPIKENDNLSPISPYGYHKCMAEEICREFSQFWNSKTCCIRIFTTFGPRLRKQLLWDIFQKSIKTDDDSIELSGTGNETCDFIYVTDVVSVIDCAIKYSHFNGDVVNAGNGKQMKITTIAHLMVEALGVNKKIKFNQVIRTGEPLYWEADVTKVISMGYKPNVDIKTGINSYVLWLKESGLL